MLDKGARTTSWVELDLVESDEYISDTIDEPKAPIVAAYDPKDKQVDEEFISPDDVAAGKKLKYTIHFQNTGDARVVNVVIAIRWMRTWPSPPARRTAPRTTIRSA